MLQSVSRFSRFFQVTVNGKSYEAVQGETVQQLCARNHIQIPRACNSFYFKGNDCNLCKVLVNGKHVQNACSTLVYKGLDIKTKSPEVTKEFNKSLDEFKKSKTFKDTPKEMQNAANLFLENMKFCVENPGKCPELKDISLPWMTVDPEKCTKCGKCIGLCPSDSLVLDPYIQANGNNGLIHSFCNTCGKCIDVCEAKAITITPSIDVLEVSLTDKKITKAAIIDPALCINLEKKLKLPKGYLSMPRLAYALMQVGFDVVSNGGVGNDLALMEEALTLTEHIQAQAPMVSSFCPAAVQTVMTRMPAADKILSSVISPSLITGLLSKSKPNVLTASFVLCAAKKAEIEHYRGTNLAYSDIVLTIDELIKVLEKHKVNMQNMPRLPDNDKYSKMAVKCMTAKGWCECVIDILTSQFFQLKDVKKTVEVVSSNVEVTQIEVRPGNTLRFAVATGLTGLKELLSKQYPDLLYIVLTECNGGCLNGICGSKGDQKEKEEILKLMENSTKITYPMDNPGIKEIYSKVFNKPGESKKYIHTKNAYPTVMPEDAKKAAAPTNAKPQK